MSPGFQSSPGPKAQSYASVATSVAEATWFQSSPGPKAQSYDSRMMGLQNNWVVPILSRPEGPELPPQSPGSTDIHLFQSSPGPKAQSYIDYSEPPLGKRYRG